MAQDPRLPDGWSQDKTDDALEWQSEQRREADRIFHKTIARGVEPNPQEQRHLDRWLTREEPQP